MSPRSPHMCGQGLPGPQHRVPPVHSVPWGIYGLAEGKLKPGQLGAAVPLGGRLGCAGGGISVATPGGCGVWGGQHPRGAPMGRSRTHPGAEPSCWVTRQQTQVQRGRCPPPPPRPCPRVPPGCDLGQSSSATWGVFWGFGKGGGSVMALESPSLASAASQGLRGSPEPPPSCMAPPQPRCAWCPHPHQPGAGGPRGTQGSTRWEPRGGGAPRGLPKFQFRRHERGLGAPSPSTAPWGGDLSGFTLLGCPHPWVLAAAALGAGNSPCQASAWRGRERGGGWGEIKRGGGGALVYL